MVKAEENYITIKEILERGLDIRALEVVNIMAGDYLSSTVAQQLTQEEMYAFGYGQACECGERGLFPGEEFCKDCFKKKDGNLVEIS